MDKNSPFKTADWVHSSNIYEVNLRQYTLQGTINAFADELPRLKEMGVKTLWFMPITPIAQKNKLGSMGSYYACSDYTAINPEYGTMADWNYDTINKIAKLLTVDKAGKDATQDGFDPANIVQWGFEPQRDDLRGLGAYWGAGSLAAADGKTAQIPEDWKTAWKFYYDGMWKDHFSMTGPIFQSTDINPEGYPFFTGKVAMSENFLWSTYGVAGAGDDWNLAAIPANGSKTTAAFNADTFRILKSTKHPDEAFEVLTYLLGDASQELLTTYGGFPARIADQPKGVEALQAQFKNKVDWQVAIDGITHADNPNFEAYMPAYNETLGLVGSGGKYTTKWESTEGLDMNAEFDALQKEIQSIWDKAGGG